MSVDISRRWNQRRPVASVPYVAPRTAEERMPPHPRGVVESLRGDGHTVTVRENRNGSLRYSVDGARETDAHTMTNRYLRSRGE
jgi:hypothetical protein